MLRTRIPVRFLVLAICAGLVSRATIPHFAPLEVTQLPVHLSGLEASLNGTQIAIVSDIHGVPTEEDAQVQDLVLQEIRRYNLSMIFILGDVVDRNFEELPPVMPFLRALRHSARNGVFAVLGNHDYSLFGLAPHISRSLRELGVTVLDHEVVNPLGPSLDIVGFSDLFNVPLQPHRVRSQAHEMRAASSTGFCSDTNVPRLALAHNPDSATILNQAGCRIDMQFSGHTHGGSIRIPSIFSIGKATPVVTLIAYLKHRLLPTRLANIIPTDKLPGWRAVNNWFWAQGLSTVERESSHKHLPENKVYVNRGLGDLRRRLFCRPELTIVTLVAT